MKKNIFRGLVALFVLAFVSCEQEVNTHVQFALNPAGVENAVIKDAKMDVTNRSTGAQSSFTFEGVVPSGLVNITVAEGIYDLKLSATLLRFDSIATDSTALDTIVSTLKASVQNIEIIGATKTIDLKNDLFITAGGADDAKGGLIIAEIFFAGTETSEGKQYNGDKYFKVYNNSSETLYADGFAIAETDVMTVTAYPEYANMATGLDDRNEKTPIQALYRIPGDGDDYPVAPGEFLLIVDNAIDHKEANTNSFDLTGADFEWYDESSNPNFMDVDNEQVTNLDKVYCYTATIWGPHNRGFCSYLLVDMGTTEELPVETYVADYTYTYEYLYTWATGSMMFDSECYYVPNSWIADAVNLSVESEFAELAIDKSLDMGWTYCGKVNADKTRYGKAVRRKVLEGKILQDTNDSSADFQAEVVADPTFEF